MKKILTLAAVAIFVSSAALADTVTVTSNTSFSDPSAGAISTTGAFAFVGTRDIIFEVAGKMCKLNGSARGSVPMGCNYTVVVGADGAVAATLSAGNSVCTQGTVACN